MPVGFLIHVSFSCKWHHEKNCFCICENKVVDQLHNRAADQRPCFRYLDNLRSIFFLNLKFQTFIHLLWLYSPACVATGWKLKYRFSQDVTDFISGSTKQTQVVAKLKQTAPEVNFGVNTCIQNIDRERINEK